MQGRPFTTLSIWAEPKTNGYQTAAFRKAKKLERWEREKMVSSWSRLMMDLAMRDVRNAEAPVATARKEWVQ